jgi:hypothetical protein
MTLLPDHGMPGYQYGHLRASTADRERAIDVLKAGFAEGRLTQDEYTDRAGRVQNSRTYAELHALTCDLPIGPLGTLALPAVLPADPPAAQVPRHQNTNTLAIAAFICALIPGPLQVAAIVAALIARREIRRTGERGDGMAVASIIIAVVGFIVFWAALWGD